MKKLGEWLRQIGEKPVVVNWLILAVLIIGGQTEMGYKLIIPLFITMALLLILNIYHALKSVEE